MNGLVPYAPYQRPRSADPYLDRPGPMFGEHSIDRLYGSYDRGLQAWLPGLYHESSLRQMGREQLIERWIADSPAVEHNAVFPLTRRELVNAFELVAEHVENQHDKLTSSGTSHMIILELEEAMRSDEVDHDPQRLLRPLECQRLFRSLAEVSYYARSGLLGDTLYRFFTRHIRAMMHNSSSTSLYLWFQAVLRADMMPALKYECLHLVTRLHPELFSRFSLPLRAGLTEIQELLSELLIAAWRSRGARSHNPWGPRIFELDDREDGVYPIADRRIAELYESVQFHESQARRGRKAIAEITGNPDVIAAIEEDDLRSDRRARRSPFMPNFGSTRLLGR